MGRWVIRDRRVYIQNLGLNPADTESWVQKWSDHKQNVKKRGSVSVLTFEDYVQLAIKAGIDWRQIGQKSEQYCLGRKGDEGIYDVENCRFITQLQNQMERRENGGLESARQKIIGRTKDDHQSIASQADKVAKNFRLVSPSGEVYMDRNLKQFCADNGLNFMGMMYTCNGRQKTHRGWTGAYLED